MRRKQVFTTGQVARICHVASRTVSKWFDSGRLEGYRVPGSRDRRIPQDSLARFMRAHGMPLDDLRGAACRALIISPSVDRRAVEALAAAPRLEVRAADTEFRAGLLIGQFRPHVVILDVDALGSRAAEFCRRIKSRPGSGAGDEVKVVALDGGLGFSAGGLRQQGFDGCLVKPLSAGRALDAIAAALGWWVRPHRGAWRKGPGVGRMRS